MASGVSIQLVGFEALERRLADMPGKIERKCYRTALRNTANKVKRDVQAGTVVRSGAAKASVKVKVRVRRGGAYAVVKYTERPQMYMRILEQGGVRQPGRPFWDALTGHWRNETSAAFLDSLKAVVERQEG